MTNQFVQPTSTIPTPPFWGTKILDTLSVSDIIPYLNLNTLYGFHWKFDRHNEKNQETAQATLKQLIKENEENSIIQPQAVYGYFACQSVDNDLIIYTSPTAKKELCRFSFPRQKTGQHLCLADFFRSCSSQEFDVVGFQLVTIGQKASDFARTLFKKDEYQKYLFWRGFNAAITEGLAEVIHRRIRLELGFHAEEPPTVADIFKQKYRGSRFSLGFSACPNLEDQQKIMALLEAQKIGVELSETFQLVPEESTSAIVVHNPQSRIFLV